MHPRRQQIKTNSATRKNANPLSMGLEPILIVARLANDAINPPKP